MKHANTHIRTHPVKHTLHLVDADKKRKSDELQQKAEERIKRMNMLVALTAVVRGKKWIEDSRRNVDSLFPQVSERSGSIPQYLFINPPSPSPPTFFSVPTLEKNNFSD